VRPPAVAGSFYPNKKDQLSAEITRCFEDQKIGPGVSIRQILTKPRTESVVSRIECFVVPHAGFMYSGPVAAHSYSLATQLMLSVRESFVVIILGPNHQGLGSGIALSPSDAWQTPLGNVSVEKQISLEILQSSEIIDVNALSHSYEHSIEVQLPFLQILASGHKLRFVPICLMLQDRESSHDVAEAIYKVIQSNDHLSEFFLILGSSDLTHYESQSEANTKDKKLIERIEALDLPSYYATLERNNISACGYGAIAVIMELSKKLGKKKGKLLKYATSGDVTGDLSSVVGYSAVHFQ
jgi:MEMO1 family protein